MPFIAPGMMARLQRPVATSLFIMAHGVASMTLSNYAKLSLSLSLSISISPFRNRQPSYVKYHHAGKLKRKGAILRKNWQQSQSYIYPLRFSSGKSEVRREIKVRREDPEKEEERIANARCRHS